MKGEVSATGLSKRLNSKNHREGKREKLFETASMLPLLLLFIPIP